MRKFTLFMIGLCAGLAGFSATLAVLAASSGGAWGASAANAVNYVVLTVTWIFMGKTERRDAKRDQDGGAP